MIHLQVSNPTRLWLKLGEMFFSNIYSDIIDFKAGDRRFFSIDNLFIIQNWPREWTGKDLFAIVGYSESGTKMEHLRQTYLDEVKWKSFIKAVKGDLGEGKSKGMTFNMGLAKKGGCLSSVHFFRMNKKNLLFIHGKIAEVPKKIVADLRLFSNLIHELDLWPIEVHLLYSMIYFSIVGLRSYVPILGKSNMVFPDLPIQEPRNYQVGSIEAIEKYQKYLIRKYGEETWRIGCKDKLNMGKGEWDGQGQTI